MPIFLSSHTLTHTSYRAVLGKLHLLSAIEGIFLLNCSRCFCFEKSVTVGQLFEQTGRKKDMLVTEGLGLSSYKMDLQKHLSVLRMKSWV